MLKECVFCNNIVTHNVLILEQFLVFPGSCIRNKEIDEIPTFCPASSTLQNKWDQPSPTTAIEEKLRLETRINSLLLMFDLLLYNDEG